MNASTPDPRFGSWLTEHAPRAADDLLDRTMGRVRAARQPRRAFFRWPALRSAAPLAALMVVAVVGGGLILNLSSTPVAPNGTPVPSPSGPSASPTVVPSPTIVPSPQPSLGASAAPASAFRVWTRLDLPDPAPGVYGGGTPSGLVAFGGGYVATGSVAATCCAGGDPSLNWGVVWTSTDGRTWQLHNHLASLAHASLNSLLTDGTSLYLFGTYAPTAGSEAAGSPTVWVSTDALHWRRSTGIAPTVAAIGPHSLVGAEAMPNVRGDTVRFLTSTDGLTWVPTSATYRASLADLAVAADGSAIALAWVEGTPFPDGAATTDIVAWRSVDGASWSGPITVAADGMPIAVAAAGDGYIASVWRLAELPNGSVVNPSEVWRLVGEAPPVVTALPMPADDNLRSVFVFGSTVILTGDTLVDGADNAMVWVSTDGGSSFGRVADQAGFSGINNEVASVVQTSGGLLAVGRRWDGTSMHPLPEAWISAP